MSERLRAHEWEVRPVDLPTCQAFTLDLHYSGGGSNSGTATHGLFRIGDGKCRGIAWWMPPTKHAAASVFHDHRRVLALSRLAIEPDVPRNAASFLLAGSRKLLPRERWACLLTYADVWRGHTGAIYRADNWEYLGVTAPKPVYLLNGRMLGTKRGKSRTRTHAEMLALGAEYIGSFPKHKFRRLA